MTAQLITLTGPLVRDSYECLPGPRPLPVIGLGLRLQREGLDFLTYLNRNYGDFVKFPMPGMRGVFVSDPHFIQTILLHTEKTFSKGTIYDRMKIFVGDGLVTSTAQLWRQQRRLANPAFNSQDLSGYQEIIFRKATILLQNLANQSGDCDIYRLITDVTMDIALESLFSVEGTSFRTELDHIFKVGQDYLAYLFWAAFPPPLVIPVKRNRNFKEARKALYYIIDHIVDERMRHGIERDDYLGRLLRSCNEESRKGMSKQLIRDELITFMIAGHDTTANTLGFTLYLLARHPDMQDLVVQEIKKVKPNLASDQNLEVSLPLTFRVLCESMRLYPTAWMLNRSTNQDIRWNDYTFKKGTIFFLSQYAVHRHPKYWAKPDDFDSDHFSLEQVKGRPEFAFFPFGGGARKCIGYRLAIQEALILLVTILEQIELALPKKPMNFQLAPNVTMSPVPGIVLRIERRS